MLRGVVQKGLVERSIRYIRDNFFAARTFTDVDDLNAQAQAWCAGPACDRRWPEDDRLTVGRAFASEQASLMKLPEHDYPVAERLDVHAGKTPYVEWHLLWHRRHRGRAQAVDSKGGG